MQLAAAARRLRREHPNLGHEVVMDFPFDLERSVDVDLAGVCLDIGNFFGRNQSETRLRLRERHPHRAPQLAALFFGKKNAKLGTAVSPRERRGIRTIIQGTKVGVRPRLQPGLVAFRRSRC